MGDDFGQCLPEEEAVCTSTSEEENIMFGPNTPYDEPDPAQIAAQIVAKFQSTCGSTVQQLQNLAASTPSSARLQTGGSGCPSPTGTSGSSNYSAPSWRSGYDASVSSPGYGGGFSPPPYGMNCPSPTAGMYDMSMMASPARTYDTSSDAVSPCPRTPRTPANRPKRQLPPPPSGKAGACSRPCSPAASASGNSKYVRPNLENILKVVQFGMGSFLQLKSCNLEKMESALITYRIHLDHGMKVMKEVDDAISCDLESLPQLIKSWGEHAQYLQILYDKSIKKPRPSPNLSAIEHPSACVNQNAYTELLKAGKSLCLEVERGLRVAEVFNSKLDTVVGDTTDEMMKTYNQICSLKETRDSMAAETQEWMRRFKEVEHSVNNFLCEWQKGGDHLNQPVPDTCAPPILDLDQLQPNQPQPSSCAQYSQAQPKQPQSSSCAQYSQAQSQPSSCAQYSPATYSSPDYTTTSDDSEEFKTRGANIERLGKVLEGKKEELASLIERFASMNTSIHLEVQQNMDQQEVLNESLRAMDDIQSPPAKSQTSPA